MPELPGNNHWLNWRQVPWKTIDPGPNLDLLAALWVYEWRVEPMGQGGAVLIDPSHLTHSFDPFEGPASPQIIAPYSTSILWGWRIFARAVLIAEEARGGIILDMRDTNGDPHLSVDTLPVRLSLEGREVWEGPLPWAATMAAIDVAEQAWIAKTTTLPERLGRWLRRKA